MKKSKKTGWFKGKWVILGLIGIVFLAWSAANQNTDSYRADSRVNLQYDRLTQDTESSLGRIMQTQHAKKELSPLYKELHEARKNGDEQRMREIEAQLRPASISEGESAGPLVRRESTTQGFPGEPPMMTKAPSATWGNPTDWGTDIHIRGTNTTFQESYPAMATASDGTIYVVWENVNSTLPHNYLQVYYSTDGGATWTAYGWFQNASFDLGEPSLAIGEGSQDLLVIAYVVMDAVPYIEVMTSPLASGTGWSPTYVTPAYYTFWESYRKPNVWTDSYDWSGWYIYLTAEAAVTSSTGNYNVIFWRSTDFGATYTSPAAVPLGNTDPYTWRDPDGSYGTTGNNVFIACYNATDSTIYELISYSFASTWDDTVAVYTLPDVPFNPVDPDIEAATNADNIQILCTKSFAGNDNIGHTFSQDAGLTWSYLFSLEGYTSLNEFAAELTANEGGNSWHVAYTSDHHAFYSTRPQDLSNFWQLTPDIVDDAQYVSHAFTKKAITSNWTTDEAGIAWSDYRDGGTDYDIYFDKNPVTLTLYKGPATNFISGGASQNTNNFADFTEGKIKSSRVMEKLLELRETPLAADPQNLMEPAAPRGSNEVDDSGATDAAPALVIDFPGIPDDQNSAGYTFIPPDPVCAAGPNHVMACVNTDFAIFDKMGNKLKEIDATLWFENVLSGLDPGFTEPFGVAYDPQIVYDHFAGHWVMSYIADDNSSQSYLLLAVSDDADPFGVWYNYAIPGNQNGSTVNSNLNDYPKLGLDDTNFYFTANMFDMGGGGFQYIQLRIIEKTQIYNNPLGPVSWTDFWDLRDPDNLAQVLNTSSTLAPAVTFGNPGVEYLINASPYTSGTFMTLWTVPNPASPTTLTAVNIPVTAYSSPPDANQLGGGLPLIDVGGRRVRNAVYRNGELVTAHSIADGSDTYARLHVVKINVAGPTVIDDISFGATNFWYYYPAITLDLSQNSVLVFNRSGNSEYAGIRYTGVLSGVIQGSVQLKAGENNYIKTFGGSRNRWGDYSGIANDPTDNDRVWMFSEYAASPANTWGTWWGEVTYGLVHPAAQNLVALDGYDGAVPVYWDPPTGYAPLDDTAEEASQVSGPKTTVSSSGVDAKVGSGPTAGGSDATLLGYDVYRATTSGGPYTYLATVNRQYFRDLTAANGVMYYYVVQAVYDDGTSGNSNEDSAGPAAGGYWLTNGYASAAPTLDGSIGASEWADATVIDIMIPPATLPVRLYSMNDGNFLYVAVDDPNNTVADDYDQIGIYFDEDHNYEWPPSSPSGEGNFWPQYFAAGNRTDYRGISGWWPANLIFDATIMPAPGVSEGISFGSGHIQYEVAIDLNTSELNASPGSTIGYYLFSYDAASGTFFGQWPDVGIFSGPFTFGTLELVNQPSLLPPQNLWAYSGYNGAVPLAWDPPSGFPPFESGSDEMASSSENSGNSKGFESRKSDVVGEPGIPSNSPDLSLLSYNIYRSTTSGGPYTLIASGVTRQYYRDETVTDGTTYYYVVTGVYDLGEGPVSNEDPGTSAAGGYLVQSYFTNSPPVPDGFIAPGEWTMAQMVDITNPGNPNTITMYMMNDGGFLYVAVDNPGDLTLDDYDQIGIYFDEDLDREWPPASPSGEGNLWVEWLSGVAQTEYRGISGWWPANLSFDLSIVPAPGVVQGISTTSGHVQFEAIIDLAASDLNVVPGNKFGMFVYAQTLPAGIFEGWWPQAMPTSPFPNDWSLPSIYGDVLLATTGPDWVANMTVTDNCANSQNLVFATAPDATIGFDPQYDQYAPPPPPPGAFDARLRTATDDFLKDFRPTNTGTTVWDVHYQAASGCSPVTLNWNPSQLPAGGSFRLKDAVTGNLVDIDMRTQSSYTDNVYFLGHLQIVYTLQITHQQSIISGWNLLGLPLAVTNSYYLDLYTNALPNTCFGWNGSYFNEDSLDLGMGYWLRFPGAETVNITGSPVSNLPINMISGWNMISGGVDCDVALADVADPGGIIIPGTLFGFNGSYYSSDSIKQGVGYWLRTSGPGTITLSCTKAAAPLAKTTVPALDLDNSPVLHISDASGAEQSLWFNVDVDNPETLLSYSLPPLPPAGAFDARFSGDLLVNETDEALIRIQASEYPVQISASGLQPAEGFRYVLEEQLETGKGSIHVLTEGETVEITNPAVRSLRLMQSALLPDKFAVHQNYPNPFNPTTQIRFDLPKDSPVEVVVFNTIGQKVRTLVSGFKPAGRYSVTWDATNDDGHVVGSGIYFYAVKAGGQTAIRKMMLLK